MKKYKVGDRNIDLPIMKATNEGYPSVFDPCSEIRLQHDLSPDREAFYLELEKSKAESDKDAGEEADLEFGEYKVNPVEGQRAKAVMGEKDPTEEERFTVEEALDDYRDGTGLLGGNVKRIGIVRDPPSIDFEDWFTCMNCGMISNGDRLGPDGSCPICSSVSTVPSTLDILEGAEEVWHFQSAYSNKSGSRVVPARVWNWYNWIKMELLDRNVIGRRDVIGDDAWFQHSVRSALMSDYWAFEEGSDVYDHRKLGGKSLKSLENLYEKEDWHKNIANPVDQDISMDGMSSIRLYKLSKPIDGEQKYIGV